MPDDDWWQVGEQLVIGDRDDPIIIRIVGIGADQVALEIEADPLILIRRGESSRTEAELIWADEPDGRA